ncbi:molybdate ABC transporter permease protein [compost metagenome]
MGASKTQTVFHHTLPLAMPGVMTGAIISMAHALGETAPLLLIGMVSFIPGIPHSIGEPTGALPSLGCPCRVAWRAACSANKKAARRRLLPGLAPSVSSTACAAAPCAARPSCARPRAHRA